MKYYMSLIVVLGLVVAASGQTYRAPIGKQKPVRPIATPPPVTERASVQGAVPRAMRGGNPLQMLNPSAPPQYGTAAESAAYDPIAGKWRGIKLFEIFF